MALKEYRKKRNFRKTPEPQGKVAKRSSKKLLYLIQKHAASHLHYDFRLELHGVLKSWAVPKGPSLDPSVKRLAVHVEDHPIEYGDFEGIIPEGYGAGTVMIWDTGNWEPDGDAEMMYQKGHLSFQLYGKKLRGGWALVRMGGKAGAGGKNWLLFKKDDEYANFESDIVEEKPLSAISKKSMDENKNPPSRDVSLTLRSGFLKNYKNSEKKEKVNTANNVMPAPDRSPG